MQSITLNTSTFFFRPWTLTPGCPEVPHISLINLTQVGLAKAYFPLADHDKGRHSADHASPTHTFSSREAWADYIGGHVVSKNAERIITSLLTQTIAGSQYEKEIEDDEKDEFEYRLAELLR